MAASSKSWKRLGDIGAKVTGSDKINAGRRGGRSNKKPANALLISAQ